MVVIKQKKKINLFINQIQMTRYLTKDLSDVLVVYY